jgi:hypothetical protein
MRNGENTAERGKGMIGVTLLIISWKRGGERNLAEINRNVQQNH